jgi:hypothetical protein
MKYDDNSYNIVHTHTCPQSSLAKIWDQSIWNKKERQIINSGHIHSTIQRQ